MNENDEDAAVAQYEEEEYYGAPEVIDPGYQTLEENDMPIMGMKYPREVSDCAALEVGMKVEATNTEDGTVIVGIVSKILRARTSDLSQVKIGAHWLFNNECTWRVLAPPPPKPEYRVIAQSTDVKDLPTGYIVAAAPRVINGSGTLYFALERITDVQ